MVKKRGIYILSAITIILIAGVIGYRMFFPVAHYVNDTSSIERKLSLNGITYVPEYNIEPEVMPSGFPFAKTEDGEGIKSIPGLSPKDWIYVMGEMEETLYRRDTLLLPQLSTKGILKLTLIKQGKQISSTEDKAIIQGLEDTFISEKLTLNKQVPQNNPFLINVYFKGYSGTKLSLLIEEKDGKFYLQPNKLQATWYYLINDTKLVQWLRKYQ